MIGKYSNFKYVFLFSLIFGVIVHGYRFMNMNLTHDSIVFFSVFENSVYLISIGRFLYYLFYGIFPIYTEPFFCGLISLCFLGIGNYFFSIFLEYNKIQTLFISSLFIVSVPFIIFSSSYLPALPLFSLSFCLSCIGMFLSKKSGYYFFGGAVFLAFAMAGEDQSIIQFACTVSFVYIIKELFSEKNLKKIFLLILKYIIFFILSGGIYFFLYKCSLFALNVVPLDSYNSSNSVSFHQLFINLTDKSLLESYYNLPYKFFFSSKTALPYNKLTKYCIILLYLFLLSIPTYLFVIKKIKKINFLLYLFSLIVSPFVINSVYFISSGVMHDFMKLSFYFPIFLGVTLFGIVEKNILNNKVFFISCRALLSFCYLPVFFLVLSSFILAKNAYFVKEQQFSSFMLNMNRILNGIENNDSYIPNETKVIFIGNLDANNNVNLTLANSCSFDLINKAFSNRFSMKGYFEYIGYKLNKLDFLSSTLDLDLDNFHEKGFSQDDILKIKLQPVFPQKGYIMFINGVLFVKLSK